MDLRRTDLKKYYKIVKICKKCNLPYGLDNDYESKYGKDKCFLCIGMVKRKFYILGTEEQKGGHSS